MIEIKFCENNFSHGTDEVITKLVDNYPSVKVVVESCLGHCGECAPGPFAIFNDKLIVTQTSMELYKELEKMI